MNIAHSGFISSKGEEGWYKTVEDDEVIIFDRPVNSLSIESKDDPLTIQINNIEDKWYIGVNKQEGIEGLRIHKMTVKGNKEQEIRWKALTY